VVYLRKASVEPENFEQLFGFVINKEPSGVYLGKLQECPTFEKHIHEQLFN
jgi:hypothetical protein